MSDELKPVYQDDEIDLVELLQTIWDGKWTVVGITVLAVVFGGAVASLRTVSSVATTEIKPITSVQEQAYQANNALEFFEIDAELLRDLFIEQLEERSVLEAAIRKHELVARANFGSDADYEAAVVALAAAIAIQPPVNADGKEKGEIRRHWAVVFEGMNAQKWLAALADVKQASTESVRTALVDRFDTAMAVSRQSREFKLEDIATRIENAKADFDEEMREFELNQGFEMEDVRTQIGNALADYERKTKDRLAFLREQAAIARELGVAKNTIEAQTFSSTSGFVANVKTDTPFYLRGYEAIEKEIELILAREDKSSFVEGLLALEQQRRQLEQDQTLERADAKKEFLADLKALEIEERSIQQDETLNRAEALFKATPVNDSGAFAAVEMEVFATEVESKSKRSLILALSLVLGGMIGVLFVLIRAAVRKRRAS